MEENDGNCNCTQISAQIKMQVELGPQGNQMVSEEIISAEKSFLSSEGSISSLENSLEIISSLENSLEIISSLENLTASGGWSTFDALGNSILRDSNKNRCFCWYQYEDQVDGKDHTWYAWKTAKSKKAKRKFIFMIQQSIETYANT